MFSSNAKNVEYFTQKLGGSFDIVNKTLDVGGKAVTILYLKTLVDDKLLAEMVLLPLKSTKESEITVENIRNNILATADLDDIKGDSENEKDKALIESIIGGACAIFVDGESEAVCADIKNFPKRSPSEPPTSAVIYGPRVGFVEAIETNIAMLRKRLASPEFIIKNFTVGEFTQTKVFVAYLGSVARDDVVKKICKKIESIKIDGVIDSNYIVSYFQQGTKVFKRCGITEKPDIVAAKLLAGRGAILVDGSPVVITLPFLLFEDLQNSNDYYSNSVYASFIRFIRLVGVFISAILPGAYLALRLYHYKVLPLRFLITIANTTEGLPFTPFVESLFIVVLFQILYEVSLRLPQYLGLATSIVGALVLGQTGVSAGLISPPAVVIIALSFISVYTVSDQIAQLTLLRVLFLVIGGTIGILGIVGGIIYFANHLATFNQFGTSYLAPYAPRKDKDLGDGLIKKTAPKIQSRPESLHPKK